MSFRKSRIAFGAFVIIASVFSTGCATRHPMPVADLEYFQIDCRIKHQQVAWLQSMRTTPDDRLLAGVANILAPWKVITDPHGRYQKNAMHIGQSDWLINQHLMSIGRNCP